MVLDFFLRHALSPSPSLVPPALLPFVHGVAFFEIHLKNDDDSYRFCVVSVYRGVLARCQLRHPLHCIPFRLSEAQWCCMYNYIDRPIDSEMY